MVRLWREERRRRRGGRGEEEERGVDRSESGEIIG